MRLSQTISKSAILTAAVSVGSCNIYEDNFTPLGQLNKSVSGAYGLTSECDLNALHDESYDSSLRPKLLVIDYYQVDDRSCRITEVEKDGLGFVLHPPEPPLGCSDTYRKIDPFGIRVEVLGKDTVKFQEIGSDKAPVTVYRCGSKIN